MEKSNKQITAKERKIIKDLIFREVELSKLSEYLSEKYLDYFIFYDIVFDIIGLPEEHDCGCFDFHNQEVVKECDGTCFCRDSWSYDYYNLMEALLKIDKTKWNTIIDKYIDLILTYIDIMDVELGIDWELFYKDYDKKFKKLLKGETK